jgi:hypothetical protein
MPHMFRAAGVLALIAFFASTVVHAGEASPEARYEAALKILSSCRYCFDIRDTSQDIKALNNMWAATQDWTVDYLNAHPQMTATQLAALLAQMHKDDRAVAAAPDNVSGLGRDLYGFGVGYNEIGNVFLASRQNGRFKVVWDIRNTRAKDVSKFPILAAWQTKSAQASCRLNAKKGTWDRCGPIFATIENLPADAKGHVRFYIDATYAQAAGETVSGQLSIWSWDGRTATPLYAKTYASLLDDADTEFSHGVLSIRAKGEFKSYSSCGACEGRQMDWKIIVGTSRIVDLGMKPVVPELDTIDDLFQQLFHHQSADNLADSRVDATLRNLVQTARKEGGFSPSEGFGMYMGSTVRRDALGSHICFGSDLDDHPLLFTMVRKGAGYFVRDVTLHPVIGKPYCQGFKN